jgi:hypothetical protein
MEKTDYITTKATRQSILNRPVAPSLLMCLFALGCDAPGARVFKRDRKG